MRNFRVLSIWQKAIDFSKNIYSLTATYPEKERFGLVSQLQRAAVSVPSNIAEGCSRRTDTEYARFLEIALGSAFEIETQLIISNLVGYIKKDELDDYLNELNVLQKQINKLISTIRNQNNQKPKANS